MTTPSIEQTILLRPQSRVATIDDDGTIKSPSGQSVSTAGTPGGTGLTPAQEAKLAGLPDAAALAASLAEKASTAQGAKADTALQPGALPLGTTIAAAQISDSGAAGRDLMRKETLSEIQSLVSGDLDVRRNPTRIATRSLVHRAVVTAVSGGMTDHVMATVEAPAVRFRVGILGLHTGTGGDATAIGKVAMAVSSSVGDSINPSGGDAAWREFTFSTLENGRWLLGKADAASPSYRPRINWSDWLSYSTIPRSDGGTLPIVMFRDERPATVTVVTESFYDISPWDSGTFTYERFWKARRQTGVAGVTTPSSFTSTTPAPKTTLLVFQYELASGEICTFAGCGDSLTEGAVNGGAGNFGSSWQWHAINVARGSMPPGVHIEYCNLGISSQTSATYSAHLGDGGVISEISPDVVIYSPFSPNDATPSFGVIATDMTQLASVRALTETVGARLLLTTPMANTASAWTAATDNIRKSFAARIKAIPHYSRVIDLDALTTDGATPARFAVGASTDGTHTNESWNRDVIAPAAAPVIVAEALRR